MSPTRRDLLSGLGAAGALALATAPGGALAQQPRRTYRIAVWNLSRPLAELREDGAEVYRAFFGELRAQGFVEGRNLIVDRYATEGRSELYEPTARKIVESKADVIVPNGSVPAALSLALTKIIPIVVPAMSDPVLLGFVSNLARPGGNLTGFSQDGGIEMHGLRLQLLKEALPRASRLGFLTTRRAYFPAVADVLSKAAATLGVALHIEAMEGPFDDANYRTAFASVAAQHVDGLYYQGSNEHITNRALIIALAGEARLPTLAWYRDDAEAGAMMSYGIDLPDNYRKAAVYVARVLNGEKPGDLPIQQPTSYDVVINARVAKALGITLPETIFFRATEVIE